jgi:type II secretory pathway predicted ATPase ExeA
MLRVREILNFESNSSKFIQVALFGTLDMAAILAEPDFRPLRSRAAGGIITLDPLDEQELTQALQFRMRVAGGPEGVFTPGCFPLVSKASNGIIRDAVDYCNTAMYLGYTAQVRQINERIVQAAIETIVKLNESSDRASGAPYGAPSGPGAERLE